MGMFPPRNDLQDERNTDGVASVANSAIDTKQGLLLGGCDRKSRDRN